MRSFILAGFLLIITGCTPMAFDATLADHADALTTGGSDKLFVVEVTSAEVNVPLADIQLTFQPIGGNMTVLNFALTVDSNGDGALGQGDTLTGIEPGPDLLNTGNAGQSFSVHLTEKTGANMVSELWEDSWGAQ